MTNIKPELSFEQVRFISWMYQTIVVEFTRRNDTHSESDIRLFREAVQRNFPEHAEQIFTIMENEIKEAQNKS